MKTSAVLMAIIVIESTISIFMLLAKKMFTASQKTRPAANPRRLVPNLLASCAIRAISSTVKSNGTIVNVMTSVLNPIPWLSSTNASVRGTEKAERLPPPSSMDMTRSIRAI